jgi:hypothetical protein
MKNPIVSVEYYNDDDRISSTLKIVESSLDIVTEKFNLNKKQITSLTKNRILRLSFNDKQFVLSLL